MKTTWKNRKHFEQKSNSTSPPQSTTELILFKLKKSSLCMSVDLLLHLWWALLKNNLLYNNCVYIICRIHLILSKEKKMNEKQSNKVTVLVNSTSATKLIWFAGKKNWVIWLALNQAGFKSVWEWYSLAFLFSVYFYIWVFSSNESLFTCHWLSNLTSL